MLFNSFVFVIFALLFFAGWHWVKAKPTLRYIYVIVFSFSFYAYDTPWWLLLLIGTAMLDFIAGMLMEKQPAYKKLWLGCSLAGNLGLLFFFKYQFFVGDNLNRLIQALGGQAPFDVQPMILPIGISFYTFQSMSYSIGIFQDKIKPTYDILHFFAYVSLWPQLVAGPIERAAHLLPQMTNPLPVSKDDVWESMMLITRGFFKKMVIADNLAPAVNTIYGSATVTPSMPLWWVGTLMFALQIYGDFSGYTDIARGFARLMGFELLLNFNHPYGATSIQEFWSKWHISLSTWFREYVYIPLGGNRAGFWVGIRNMWITMLVSGVWHGAAWTFVIWGALHAAYLTIERLTDWPKKLAAVPGGRHWCALITLGLVLIAWVFFRAVSAEQAFAIVGSMLNPTQMDFAPLKTIELSAWFFLGVGILMVLNPHFGWSRTLHEKNKTLVALRPVAFAALAMICVFWKGPGNAFIYFQF
jgi:D-alanyl-lipoteichoic acid acyltransferase DltB (MBOAT superfamily)